MFIVDQPFGVGVRAEASFSMVPASSAVVVVVVERRRKRRRKKERRRSAIEREREGERARESLVFYFSFFFCVL